MYLRVGFYLDSDIASRCEMVALMWFTAEVLRLCHTVWYCLIAVLWATSKVKTIHRQANGNRTHMCCFGAHS